jgi:trehalose 6-phosphate phosphatase
VRLFWDLRPGLLRPRGRPLLLVLDYDGTLVPFTRAPSRARLPAAIRRALRGLNAGARGRVAVLSGRSLRDVSRQVGLPGLIYGGNHGLEMRGPGFAYLNGRAAALRPVLRAAAALLRHRLHGLPAVRIEDKGLSLSVHYRALPAAGRPALRRIVLDCRRQLAARPLLWREGNRVWEVLPRVGWDKGRAVRLMLRRFPGRFPMAVGDDATDEDMFRALKGRGLGVAVGRRKSSRAACYVRGQREVPRLLAAVASALEAA